MRLRDLLLYVVGCLVMAGLFVKGLDAMESWMRPTAVWCVNCR